MLPENRKRQKPCGPWRFPDDLVVNRFSHLPARSGDRSPDARLLPAVCLANYAARRSSVRLSSAKPKISFRTPFKPARFRQSDYELPACIGHSIFRPGRWCNLQLPTGSPAARRVRIFCLCMQVQIRTGFVDFRGLLTLRFGCRIDGSPNDDPSSKLGGKGRRTAADVPILLLGSTYSICRRVVPIDASRSVFAKASQRGGNDRAKIESARNLAVSGAFRVIS